MIYTITLSPAIDYKIQVSKFEFNKTIRLDDSYFEAGGKGVNVSIVLNELETKNEAILTAGGTTEELFLNLLDQKLKNPKIFKTANNVRINIKGHSPDADLEINDRTKPFTDEIFNQIKTYLESNVREGDYVLFCGSPPTLLNNDVFLKLIEKIKVNINLVVDSRKEYIDPLIQKGLFLIKPNLQELEDFTDKKIENINDVDNAARTLIEKGVKNVLVSLDKDGSILYSNNYRRYVKLDKKINVIDATGAGDSMVAGFIAAHSRNLSLEECHNWGVAAATATVTGRSLATKKDFDLWLKNI